MKTFVAIAANISLFIIASARADLTIVQKVETGGQSGSATVKIKGDMERIDAPEQPTRILDGKNGQMIDLMTERKSYLKISADQIKAAAETISKFNEGKPAATKLTPTGKKETINGYEAEEFVYETPQFKASFWVAPKYPDAVGILKEMQAPVSGAWKPSNLGMPDYTDFGGIPLKSVISGGGSEMTTTIMSIKREPVSAAEFEIPKDFKELSRPGQSAPGAPRPTSGAASPSTSP
jgi:hypothetical protein